MELGGLSSLAWDPRSAAWVSAVDNHGSDPARIWFFRNLTHPTVIRDPLSMISDDNFSATQFTRVLNLLVKLP